MDKEINELRMTQKPITNKNETEMKNETKTTTKEKKKKISTSYTIKRLKETIKTLQEGKMTTKEENEQLIEIYKTITHRWISKEMEI